MTLKFCSLASGSSGNCEYIETDKIRILIDAGLSGIKIQNALKSIDVDPNSIDCILVTHEHKDHTKGVGILSRRFDLPIYANEGTWRNMEQDIGCIDSKNIKIIKTNSEFEIENLGVLPFSIHHDAQDPVGYCFYHEDKKISIVTDTGYVCDNIKNIIKNSDLMMIESNHDIEMLKVGKYPWFLKKRILGDCGHLSNNAAGELIADIFSGNNEIVLLSHLSKENNFPELAYQTVANVLDERGINVNNDIQLGLTSRHCPTEVYNIK